MAEESTITARAEDDKIRCDACPVMCYIRPGLTGACDRYANRDGELIRVDPHIVLDRTLAQVNATSRSTQLRAGAPGARSAAR